MTLARWDVDAQQIVKALEARHKDDVTMAELTLGNRRMDFWALKRSWSPVTSWGYEIKVTRQDFMGDDKWPVYRDAVHHFSFACPWKLIAPEELPEGVGLTWLTNTGKLQTKVKAHRSEPKPEKFEKCLIRRCWGHMHTMPAAPASKAHRAEIMRDKVKALEVGRDTAGILGYKRAHEIKERERVGKKRDDEIAKLQHVRDWCQENGIDLNKQLDRRFEWDHGSINDQLKQFKTGVSRRDIQDVKRIKEYSSRLCEALESITRGQA